MASDRSGKSGAEGGGDRAHRPTERAGPGRVGAETEHAATPFAERPYAGAPYPGAPYSGAPRGPGPFAGGHAGHPGTGGGPVSATVSLTSGLNLLLGLWLIMAPFTLDYTNSGGGLDGYWNDVVIGAAIGILALLRIAGPARFAPLSWVNFVLGGWLVIAPFVLAYNRGTDAPEATWNDVAVGALVIVLAGISAAVGRREKRQTEHDRDHPAGSARR